MKRNLDYLLEDPRLCQVWVELKLTKTNPLHEDYYRLDSVEVTLDEASKIAHAKCKGIVVEYQGKEYTNTWDGKPMPRLTVGKARLWCSKAWELSSQKRQLENVKIKAREQKVSTVVKYLVVSLGISEPAIRQELYDLGRARQGELVDNMLPKAEKYLAQRDLVIATSQPEEASLVGALGSTNQGIEFLAYDDSIPLEETKARLEEVQSFEYQKNLNPDQY